MVRICVCDDTREDLDQLCRLLDQYGEERPAAGLDLFSCHDPDTILQTLAERRFFDIYILDMVMPGMTGIKLGEYIRSHNETCTIIYQTISPEYALDAFSVSAFHYLLKPLTAATLFPVLDRAIRRLDGEGETGLPIKTPAGRAFVPYPQLCYVELCNRAPVFHLRDGSRITGVQLRGSLEEALAPMLQEGRFLHPHKSYLVNMHFIQRYTATQITLEDGVTIPVSKRKAVEVRKTYLDFLNQKLKSVSLLPHDHH